MQIEHGDPQNEQSISMKVPLIFLNNGGATRFVQDVVLILRQNESESNELFFVRSAASMDDNAIDSMAQQFVIEGHKSYSSVFLFHRNIGNFAPSVGICKARVKVKLDNEEWKIIHEFDFKIGPNQNLHLILPHYCDQRE